MLTPKKNMDGFSQSYLRLDNLPVIRNVFGLKFTVRDPGHRLSLQLISRCQSGGRLSHSNGRVRWRDIESGEVCHWQAGGGSLLTGDVGDAVLDVLVGRHVEQPGRDGGELGGGGRVCVALSHLTALTAARLRGGEHGGREGLPGVDQPHQGRGGVGEVRGVQRGRVRVCWRWRVVFVQTDQAVLSVPWGMVERTGRLQQIRDRKCHQVIICFLSPAPHLPPPMSPPRLWAPRSPWQRPIDTLSHQPAVEVIQELRPRRGVGAPGHRVVLAVRRGLHLLRVDQDGPHHGRRLRREVRGGGRSHSLPPPGRQGQRAMRVACPPPPLNHLQLLNHRKVVLEPGLSCPRSWSGLCDWKYVTTSHLSMISILSSNINEIHEGVTIGFNLQLNSVYH